MINTSEFLREALEELNRIDNDPQKRYICESEEKELRDQISSINYAKNKGREQAIKEGRERGIKEAYIAVAKSLLKLNMSEEDILNNIEGLSEYLLIEDLKKIKNDLN